MICRFVLPALLCGSALAHAESVTYTIDPTHTFVTFETSHAETSTLRGRFDKKQGSVTIDREAHTGQTKIKIDVTSLNTGIATLDQRLKSSDFFDADRMNMAVFDGDKFSFDGDNVTAVSGTLSMHGKTVPITLRAERFNCYTHPLLRRQVCGGDFQVTIKRSRWDMTYGLDHGLSDDVHLLIQIEAIRQ